jgi:hypothetical protein
MIHDNQGHRGRTQESSVTKSETLSDAIDGTIGRKISFATEGLQPYVENWLRIKTSNSNALTISEYVLSLRREINPSQNYTRMQIQALVELSEYSKQKPFEQMTRDHVLSFLYKFRKTENSDPLHKWIGTYNIKHEILRQFFTWLNGPNTERNQRLRPKIMENIPKFKRKEISIYKPTDLWTGEDDLLFLRYCPNKRESSVIITKCLTRTCEECTGSYINKILNHKFICRCSCGHTSNKNSAILHVDLQGEYTLSKVSKFMSSFFITLSRFRDSYCFRTRY